jgi:hypothetical protein
MMGTPDLRGHLSLGGPRLGSGLEVHGHGLGDHWHVARLHRLHALDVDGRNTDYDSNFVFQS